MNALTTTKAAVPAASFAGPDPFAAAARELGVQNGSFLKFSGNTGEFTYGAGDAAVELEHGTRLAADMAVYSRGWICWKDGEVVDEHMTPILDGDPIAEADLEDHGPYEKYPDGTEDGWSAQHQIELRSTEDGTQFTYKTTSSSGKRALGKLLADFAKVYKSHPGEIPVVEISSVTFEIKKNKKAGKKHAPVFKLVDWISQAGFDALAEAAEAAKKNENDDEGADDEANYADAASETKTEPQHEPETKAAAAPAETGGRRAKRF